MAPEFDFDLRQVYASTFAIVFFGTPHQGSPSISWNKVVGNIALATGFEQSRLLTQTTTSSTPDTIDAIQAGFNDMQDDGAFKTFYFQESLPDNLLGGKVRMVEVSFETNTLTYISARSSKTRLPLLAILKK